VVNFKLEIKMWPVLRMCIEALVEMVRHMV